MEHNSSDVFAIFVPNSPDRHVFKELKEVKKFLDSPLGKKDGTRFKKCAGDQELNSFFEELSSKSTSTSTPSPSTSAEPVSPYSSLPDNRFNEFRRTVEQKNESRFEELLKENPRFLVNTNTDSPAILQKGYRYNALHVACKTSNVHAARRCLELASNLEWLADVFGTDRCAEERSQFLLDAFLNTPDLIENNTPLHYACKFGQPDIVRLLLGYSACKRYPTNKYNEKPMDKLCRSFKGTPEEKQQISDEIRAIFRRGLSPHRNAQRAAITNEPNTSPVSSLATTLRDLDVGDETALASPATPRSSTAVANASRKGFRDTAARRSPSPSLEDSPILPNANSTPIAENDTQKSSSAINSSSSLVCSPTTAEVLKIAEEFRVKLDLNASPSNKLDDEASSTNTNGDLKESSTNEDDGDMENEENDTQFPKPGVLQKYCNIL